MIWGYLYFRKLPYSEFDRILMLSIIIHPLRYLQCFQNSGVGCRHQRKRVWLDFNQVATTGYVAITLNEDNEVKWIWHPNDQVGKCLVKNYLKYPKSCNLHAELQTNIYWVLIVVNDIIYICITLMTINIIIRSPSNSLRVFALPRGQEGISSSATAAERSTSTPSKMTCSKINKVMVYENSLASGWCEKRPVRHPFRMPWLRGLSSRDSHWFSEVTTSKHLKTSAITRVLATSHPYIGRPFAQGAGNRRYIQPISAHCSWHIAVALAAVMGFLMPGMGKWWAELTQVPKETWWLTLWLFHENGAMLQKPRVDPLNSQTATCLSFLSMEALCESHPVRVSNLSVVLKYSMLGWVETKSTRCISNVWFSPSPVLVCA